MIDISQNTYLLDSWAWVEYFDATKHGGKIKEYLENVDNAIITCSINLAEVVRKFVSKENDPHIALKGINSLSKIIPLDSELAFSSGELHAKLKHKSRDFGLADAIVLATARKHGAKILTGDPHFKNFKEAILFS